MTVNHRTYTTDSVPSDVPRAVFLGDPILDNLFSAFTALGMEVWSVRRRMKVMESLLQQHGVVSQEMVERYKPSPEENAAWAADRDAFIKLLYEPFMRQGDLPFASSLHPDVSG